MGSPRNSDYLKSLCIVFLNITMLVVAMYLISKGAFVATVLGVFLWALQMNHAYLIVHECTHGSFFRKSYQNKYCGQIFSFLCILPFYSRQLEHISHHHLVGTFQERTTIRAMERFAVSYGHESLSDTLIAICWKMWVPLFAINEHLMIWKISFGPEMPFKKKCSGAVTLLLYGVIILIFLFLFPFKISILTALTSVVPAIYIYMMLIEYFNIPHHTDSDIQDIDGNVPFYDQTKYTKSCAPLPFGLNDWYCLNFNFHEAHHLYPNLHWTQLKEAHNIMRKYDPTLGNLDSEFQINRNLRKKPFKKALRKYFDHLPTFIERQAALKTKY